MFTAAAAVASTVTTEVDAATAAALSAGQDDEDDPNKRINQDRRKRYREAKLEDEKDEPIKNSLSHESQLASRRLKDRQRYANMTPEQRQVYNSKRREQYHRQSEISRIKRRERERSRYHALTADLAKERNARRARLERERYQRLSPDELEQKNRRRRERAAFARQKKEAAAAAAAVAAVAAGELPPEAMDMVVVGEVPPTPQPKGPDDPSVPV